MKEPLSAAAHKSYFGVFIEIAILFSSALEIFSEFCKEKNQRERGHEVQKDIVMKYTVDRIVKTKMLFYIRRYFIR